MFAVANDCKHSNSRFFSHVEIQVLLVRFDNAAFEDFFCPASGDVGDLLSKFFL